MNKSVQCCAVFLIVIAFAATMVECHPAPQDGVPDLSTDLQPPPVGGFEYVPLNLGASPVPDSATAG